MSASTRESRSRAASVMTETADCGANPALERNRHYGPVSSRGTQASEVGLNRTAGNALEVLALSPRDAWVMTRATTLLDPNAVALSDEVVSPKTGACHSLGRSHRGGAHVRRPLTIRALRNLRSAAGALVGTALDPCRLVRGGALRPLEGGRVERRDQQRLRGRNAVLAVDVAVGWRPGRAVTHGRDRALGVGVLSARAALAFVSRLASGRWVVAGVGHCSSVRAQVTV